MPCDVATRWNSTFDMLDFAIQYQSAIDDITADKNASLCKYELEDEERAIATQLYNTLKVRVHPISEINSHHQCSLVLLSARYPPRYSRM
jgi:hypothetical protein